jgi:hypothetical protein
MGSLCEASEDQNMILLLDILSGAYTWSWPFTDAELLLAGHVPQESYEGAAGAFVDASVYGLGTGPAVSPEFCVVL